MLVCVWCMEVGVGVCVLYKPGHKVQCFALQSSNALLSLSLALFAVAL